MSNGTDHFTNQMYILLYFYTMLTLRALKLELNKYLFIFKKSSYSRYFKPVILSRQYSKSTQDYYFPILYSTWILLKYCNSTLLYSTRVTIFTSLLYYTWVVKFHYFTQHCRWNKPLYLWLKEILRINAMWTKSWIHISSYPSFREIASISARQCKKSKGNSNLPTDSWYLFLFW